MPLFGILLMFLGLIFIMLPLLLFPLNLISHFRQHRTGLPQWSYSFLVTIVPIVLVLLVPAWREALLEWPEISTAFGLAVLVWYALIAAALVLDIRRNKEMQQRVMKEGEFLVRQQEADKAKKQYQVPVSQAAAGAAGKQVEAVLVISRSKRSDVQKLLEQIYYQQITMGNQLSPSLSANWVVAGNSIGDPNYTYATLRTQFPNLGAEVFERTVRFPFQAPDGETGEYYVVYG